MRIILFQIIELGLIISHSTHSQEWKRECVGYYQIQLPDSLEVALYPVEGFTNPTKRPESNGFFITNRYARNGITFGGGNIIFLKGIMSRLNFPLSIMANLN